MSSTTQLAGLLTDDFPPLGPLLSLELVVGAVSLFSLTAMVVHCIRRRPSLAPFQSLCQSLPWSSEDLRRLLLYWCAFTAFMVLCIWSGRDENTGAISSSTLLLQGIVGQVVFLLYLASRLRALKIKPAVFLGITPAAPARRLFFFAIFLCLAALPLFALASAVWSRFLVYYGIELSAQPAVEILQTATEPWWIRAAVFSAALVLAPLIEESIFRGILLPVACRQFGAGYGIVILSLIFAVLHPTVEGILPLFVMAVFFSLGYAWTGSLLVPIVMHMTFNLIELALLCATLHWGPQVGT